MARGLKKHLKRLNAARQWMLDKLGGAFAPKPSSGPAILMQGHLIPDLKVITDKTYPSRFMDVFSIPINFRLLYDTTRRFGLLLRKDEAKLYIVDMGAEQNVDPDRVTALYLETLSSVLGSKGAALDSLVYSYKHVFSGFAATLTDSQAKQIAGLPGVLSVDLSTPVYAATTRPPSNLFYKASLGEGIITDAINSGSNSK